MRFFLSICVSSSVNTGTNKKLEIAETQSPEISTTPSGCHKPPPYKVRGINPPMVVSVVNSIGVKRVALALSTDACFVNPSAKFLLALSINIMHY